VWVAPGTNGGVRNELFRPDEGPPQFGTETFYSSLGRAFVVMCAVVPGLFLIEVLNWALGHSLSASRGISPRQLDSLDGVLFAPLLHWGFGHLYANSIPLILLGTFVLAAGMRRFLWSTGLIVLVGGLGTWVIGSEGVHAGASGVIFGFLGLLLARGVVERSWWNAAVALLIGLLYWWQLAGLLPDQDSPVSWEGHLFGFIGGVLAAILFRQRRRKVPRDPDPDPTIPLPDFRMPR
jgi:membrane associated rhomboid family serine protease